MEIVTQYTDKQSGNVNIGPQYTYNKVGMEIVTQYTDKQGGNGNSHTIHR